MMKEWTRRGRGVLMGSATAGALSTNDAALIVHQHNLVAMRANWLELVAMACADEWEIWRDDNLGGYVLQEGGSHQHVFKWSGTIADGHSHTAELAKALGLSDEPERDKMDVDPDLQR